jgi:putative heme iron utilization protein
MSENMSENVRNVLRPVDDEARRLAKTLIRTARAGALATIDPRDGYPIASRVGVATDIDGAPTILISGLSAHTGALTADGRCSLLVGIVGRGDPLAHPRMSIACDARVLERGSDDQRRIEGRYLRHSEKAQLYAALPDFRFFRLEPRGASLNGGFGRAFALERDDFLTLTDANAGLAELEPGAVEHMNTDHAEAVGLIARHFAGAPAGRWRLIGIDADGIDLADGDDVRRVFFSARAASADEVRPVLVAMAKEARQALAAGG